MLLVISSKRRLHNPSSYSLNGLLSIRQCWVVCSKMISSVLMSMKIIVTYFLWLIPRTVINLTKRLNNVLAKAMRNLVSIVSVLLVSFECISSKSRNKPFQNWSNAIVKLI